MTENINDFMLKWHERLGHPSISTTKHMIRNKAISGIGIDLKDWNTESFKCKDCNIGKMIRKPYQSKTKYRIMPNSRLHIDTKGPINPPSGDYRYFLVIVDESTRKGYVHLLSSKNESFAKILLTIQRLRTQYPQYPVQNIRLDNAAEFTSTLFKNYCRAHGINLEYSTPESDVAACC